MRAVLGGLKRAIETHFEQEETACFEVLRTELSHEEAEELYASLEETTPPHPPDVRVRWRTGLRRVAGRCRRGLRVELDDEPLLDRDRERDFAALGVPGERALELVLVHVHVGRRVGRELEGLPHVDEGLRLVGDLDRLPGPDLGAGTSTRRPSTFTWPWLTSWRAWRWVSAKPIRSTTASRRVSSWRISSSPVTPVFRLARS